MKIKLQNISLLILPVLSLLFAGWGHPAHAELPLRGNDNPVLAVNASVAHDWSPGMQFLNLMKSARPWIGHRSDAWGGMTYEELRDGGFLDDEGWVVQVPDGLRAVGTVFDWAPNEAVQPYRSGRYVLRFEGQGKIKMKGNARIISIDPNEIVFEIREGKTWMMDIASTDPEGTGDYIRNISIVPERQGLYSTQTGWPLWKISVNSDLWTGAARIIPPNAHGMIAFQRMNRTVAPGMRLKIW